MTTFSLPNADNIHDIHLSNGIRALIYQNPSAKSVVINGSLPGGTNLEQQPDQAGLASMLTVGLMRGTQSRPFEVFSAALEDIGADISFGAGTHRVGFSGHALAEDMETLIALLADALRYPTFPAHEIERLRGERITSIKYNLQQTQWRARRAFRARLYPPTHPYHYGTQGTLESMERIAVEDFQRFHQTWYAPEGMVITVVGAIQPEEARAAIERHLGDWSNPQRPTIPELPVIEPPTAMQREDIAIAGKSQADVFIGTVGPARMSPDYWAANLANNILGVFGMMGRVGQAVREDAGLAYYAGSALEGGQGQGAWYISAGVDPANLEEAIGLCLAQIERLVSQPVDADELADNQSYFIGRLPLQLENNAGLAATIHLMATFDLGLNYLLDYPQMIRRVTVEQVQQVAQRYFDPQALVIASAGPGVVME